jgi:cystathionine gamma-synthase
VAVAERKLAALEAAEDCALFASGMAAITTTLLTLLRPGQHVVLTADGYRRTRQFVTGFLAKFGVEHTLVEPGDLAALAAAIVPGKTRVVLTESPTNPYLRVADLPALAELKPPHRGLKLLIDSTFATPINQQPLPRAPTSSSTPAPSTSAATTTCSPAPSAATPRSSASSASCAACSAACSTRTAPTS